MRILLQQKIDELKALAEQANDPNVQIIMLALSGAMESGDEELLAGKMREFIKDVLLPRAKARKMEEIARKN